MARRFAATDRTRSYLVALTLTVQLLLLTLTKLRLKRLLFRSQHGLTSVVCLIAAKPRKLVIPPALQFVATRLLETEGRVGTADNDLNALRNNGSIPEGYAVNHYLTDTNAWFLLTDVPNGLKHFVRTPMQTSMDADFDTGNSRYKARERYSFGVSDPLGIFGSPGAA
jgi:hypothetical protein